MRSRALRVGLTGGLATGKTHVARLLASLGCRVLSADQVGHEVLLPDGEAYQNVVGEFGPGILDPDGSINRRRLAAEVFDRPDRLEKLNSLVHPPVIQREEAWLAGLGPEDIAVVEAAILIETGSFRRFDRLILTVCPPEMQIQRYIDRSRGTEAEARARLARQMSLDEKRRYAHFLIDTSGSREDTDRQVREVFQQLQQAAV
jgi:dephospho-CoA kinase